MLPQGSVGDPEAVEGETDEDDCLESRTPRTQGEQPAGKDVAITVRPGPTDEPDSALLQAGEHVRDQSCTSTSTESRARGAPNAKRVFSIHAGKGELIAALVEIERGRVDLDSDGDVPIISIYKTTQQSKTITVPASAADMCGSTALPGDGGARGGREGGRRRTRSTACWTLGSTPKRT